MSGIGFQELIILMLIGLIVLGPERLPKVANQLGNWLGQARRMTRVMKRQLEDELNLEKELSIRPQSRDPVTPPEYTPPRDDDTYSASHEEGDPGTGVDDDEEIIDEPGGDDVVAETSDDDADTGDDSDVEEPQHAKEAS